MEPPPSGATVIARFERAEADGESIGTEFNVPLMAAPIQLQQILKRFGGGACTFHVVGGAEVSTTLGDAMHGYAISTEQTVHIACTNRPEYDALLLAEPKHTDYQCDGRFDSAGFNKAHATWRKQKSRMLESGPTVARTAAPTLTPQRGLVQLPRRPRQVEDPHDDAQRQAKFEECHKLAKEARAALTIQMAQRRMQHRIEVQKQRHIDTERIDAEARRVLREEGLTDSSIAPNKFSHAHMSLVVDSRGEPCDADDRANVVLAVAEPSLLRYGSDTGQGRVVGFLCGLSDDLKRRTEAALAELGCHSANSTEVPRGAGLQVRRSPAYWEKVDSLLQSHELTHEQFAFHLRAVMAKKVRNVLNDMEWEVMAGKQLRAAALQGVEVKGDEAVEHVVARFLASKELAIKDVVNGSFLRAKRDEFYALTKELDALELATRPRRQRKSRVDWGATADVLTRAKKWYADWGWTTPSP